MRIGCCASMIAPQRDPMGIESVEAIAAVGFDYIELSLSHLALAAEETFHAVQGRVARSGLRTEACNNFFPPSVRLTGPEADREAALRYAELALGRAQRLGVEVIVLGSSGAKNVPEGFSLERAREQLVALLLRLGPLAARHRVTIALEPISRPEANFIIRTEEALALVREVDHPAIRLLVDWFHMAGEGEDPSVIGEAGGLIRHAHFARPGSRAFPTAWEEGYGPFLRALAEIGYRERLSIEAFTADFGVDGPAALEVLRRGGPFTPAPSPPPPAP